MNAEAGVPVGDTTLRIVADPHCPPDVAYLVTPMPQRRDFPGKSGQIRYEKALAEWTRTIAKMALAPFVGEATQ